MENMAETTAVDEPDIAEPDTNPAHTNIIDQGYPIMWIFCKRFNWINLDNWIKRRKQKN